MSKLILLAAATAATIAATSLATAPNAEAHKYRHKHRWGGGVVVAIGPPFVYGGYHRYREGRFVAGPYYYGRYEPHCYRWGWVYSRSGRAKWRCVAW